MLLSGERDLLADLYQLGQRATTVGGRRHVAAGLSRRHLLLQRCRLWLRKECSKHKKTVTAYVATDLAVYVNAYYLSLAGALDNLAWLLLYELKLLTPVDEDDIKTRRLATLTSKKLRGLLAESHPEIGQRVEQSVDWYWDIRDLRDPAAHRLPLTVVAGVLDADDHREAIRLKERASEAMNAGDIHEGMDLLFQASSLGTFRPWLENPEGYQKGFYYLPNLLMRDQAFYVDLAGAVVASLLLDLGLQPRVPVKKEQVWMTGDYLAHHRPYRFGQL